MLLDKIPSGSYHHGGRLEIGPDGKLYATAGDASEAAIAQDLNSWGGKILYRHRHDDQSESRCIIKMGKIDSGVEALKNYDGPIKVKFELMTE